MADLPILGGEATKSEIVQAIYRALPYSDQITGLDIESEDSGVRFTWRGDTFRVSVGGHVEQCERGCLHGSNLALLARSLIKGELVRQLVRPTPEPAPC